MGGLCPSQDDRSIPGIPGSPIGESKLCPSRDDPGLVGVSRESQDTPIGESKLCPSQDDQRMVEVSRESQDTPIWEEVSSVHPGMILGWLKYPGNPRILGHWEK